jgi:radical SAM protein with 4Fe4S-binding SPASM domain
MCGKNLRNGDGFPEFLQLDVSTKCNLACLICSLKRFYRKGAVMGMEIFEKIEPYAARFKTVMLGCNGEPLLNKNLFTMAERLRKRAPKTWIVLVTNGTLLTERTIQRMLSSGISEVVISIDGARKETFEIIRKGAKFKQVIRTIHEIVEQKKLKNSPLPILTVRYTVNVLNVGELPQFIKQAAQWHIAEVCVSNTEPYFAYFKEKPLYYDSNKTKEFANIFLTCLMLAKKLKIKLTLPPLTIQKDKKCILNMLHISPEGNIFPCSTLSYTRPYYFLGQRIVHERILFGNIAQSTVEDVWNNKRFKKLRKDLLQGKNPKYCRKCLVRTALY